MGLYRDQVLPRVIDKVCAVGPLTRLRRQAVEGLSGTVVEIGFGSGLNVPHYPAEVSRVLAVDPASVGRKLARHRLADSPVPVEFVGLDAGALPLPDASADSALSTFTLCTVPDPDRAARELWRVLRPGGTLHILEHGRSPDPRVARWQHRIEPLNRRLAGGCHLARDHWAVLQSAGFVLERRHNEYGRGPRAYAYHYLGTARRPPSPTASPEI